MARCLGQVGGVFGEKGHRAAAFACEADAKDSDRDKIVSDEKEAFICDAPGKSFCESDEGGYAALTLGQMGEVPIVCIDGGSCYMCPTHLPVG